MPEKILVIAGPTAVGKTRLAIALARRLGGEIVSADSMQVYRGMDIGTAKATAAERAQAPHHMLDVAWPWEDYSVARYVQEAAACCEDILARGKLPILAGGTGLYIDSLLAGRDFAPRGDREEALRQALSAEYDALGGEAMLEKLRQADPERADKLHPADKRRIVRALEIFRLTGVTATEHDRQTRLVPPRYEALRLVLQYADRQDLYRRIDDRVYEMLQQGLFEEVAGLLDRGLSPESTAMQAIGYKEAALALAGALSREEAAALIKQNSRRYAKRQLTWFGRWEDAVRILWQGEPDLSAALQTVGREMEKRGFSWPAGQS